jgi:hypothetical protein
LIPSPSIGPFVTLPKEAAETVIANDFFGIDTITDLENESLESFEQAYASVARQ